MLSDSCHGGQHAVVLIVVLVHAVAADEKQVLDTIREFAEFVKAAVGAEVSGVGLWNPDDMGVGDRASAKNADAFRFLDGELTYFPRRSYSIEGPSGSKSTPVPAIPCRHLRPDTDSSY